MSKVIIHNPLANQHLDHSHMKDRINKVDNQATKRLQEDLIKSYNRLYNSPGMTVLRERDKGIHPTSHDR